MNYFEFFELPVSFHPDASLLKLKFYELSKKYHPDFYANYTQKKQDEVLELSTYTNKAYQVLIDPQQRLSYILELKGILTEGENYALPQDFLMEMMDVNEALMELQTAPDADRLEGIKKDVLAIENDTDASLEGLTSSYDSSADTSALALVKDLYYRKKYLKRINDSLFKLESEL